MKKILFGVLFLVGATTMAHANTLAKQDNIEFRTSCGSTYYIDTDGASIGDIIDTALWLESRDCG
jgi:hypothetical protein